ncbi:MULTISPECIES: hypothetical protein [Pseudomonas]|uniref:hypothetical protein n=1 Tax=Pseudomonas TaxID=286 RepID=UPI001E49A680|nr:MULTISPECIES: hypothetical protein [Pseudomonas]MCE1114157.1 hypothetical protein [Pseudomonas sp. NMI795_08]
MNNTNQMLCVPRELLEQALDAAAAVGMQDVADELDRILTPTAKQHGVGPVALPARMPTGNITEPHHPWAPGVREGWNKCLDEVAKLGPLFARPHLAEQDALLPPVEGNLLPSIGSEALIYLARENKWVEHTVVGYYVWENHRPDPSVHRVFVRVRDHQGHLNARMLGDIRPVDAALECKP